MTRTIGIFIFPGAQSLDISGPMEVFAIASRQHMEESGGAPIYALRFLASRPGLVRMASGMQLLAESIEACSFGELDTLLVSGGMGDSLDHARADTRAMQWLRDTAAQVRRAGSVCSGALLLAEAGVLSGRRATTHWLDIEQMRINYPLVDVVSDAIYIRDGDVWSSAGITAGMDLALAMLADDHGLSLALKVAKRMVMVVKRSGGQSQFSDHLAAQSAPDDMAKLSSWLAENLKERISVDDMAQQVHMSPRNFSRHFAIVFRKTPQKYVEAMRIEHVKSFLENTPHDLKTIATLAGFASSDALRRTFQRQLGISPAQYRARFTPQ